MKTDWFASRTASPHLQLCQQHKMYSSREDKRYFPGVWHSTPSKAYFLLFFKMSSIRSGRARKNDCHNIQLFFGFLTTPLFVDFDMAFLAWIYSTRRYVQTVLRDFTCFLKSSTEKLSKVMCARKKIKDPPLKDTCNVSLKSWTQPRAHSMQCRDYLSKKYLMRYPLLWDLLERVQLVAQFQLSNRGNQHL